MANFFKIQWAIICLLSITILYSCNAKIKSTYPVDVALNLAGNNKAELEKVIDYYQKSGDSMKLKAAYFLITNMLGKKYVEYKPCDSIGNIVHFNLFDYSNYVPIRAAKKKLEDSLKCTFSYMPSRVVEDIKTIKADFLIENIEYAFKAWQIPWAKHLPFDEF